MGSDPVILAHTLQRLKELYSQQNMKPGSLLKVGIKPGWNVVIGTGGQCGMAMNFTGSEAAFGKPSLELDRLRSFIGTSLFDVARYYIERPGWQERSIGVAALSALSQPFLTPAMLGNSGYEVAEGTRDLSSFVRPDDVVTVVGYGGGISRLLGKSRELHVTDMRPREDFQTLLVAEKTEFTPRGVIVHPEADNPSVISQSTVVLITGSTLVNGTFEELMGHTQKARLVGMYGASASMIPDVLFERGVSFIHSYRLTDPAAFEEGMLNDMGMEPVVQRTQQQQTVGRKGLVVLAGDLKPY